MPTYQQTQLMLVLPCAQPIVLYLRFRSAPVRVSGYLANSSSVRPARICGKLVVRYGGIGRSLDAGPSLIKNGSGWCSRNFVILRLPSDAPGLWTGVEYTYTVLCAHQLRSLRIVHIPCDTPIFNPRNSLINDEQRNKKPLLRLHGMAKAVVDGDVQARGCEQPVEQPLQPGAVNACELVGGYHFDLRQRVGGVVFGIGDARLYLAAGHTNFMDDITMLSHIGVIG